MLVLCLLISTQTTMTVSSYMQFTNAMSSGHHVVVADENIWKSRKLRILKFGGKSFLVWIKKNYLSNMDTYKQWRFQRDILTILGGAKRSASKRDIPDHPILLTAPLVIRFVSRVVCFAAADFGQSWRQVPDLSLSVNTTKICDRSVKQVLPLNG